MSTFKDNFSRQANIYAQYRPDYPQELFAYLSSLTPGHSLAWDCGTGNGQAALGLTRYFDKVYATDPSAEQIKNAAQHHNIEYKVQKAEECELADNSADIITVAQALHWFDFDTFYAVVNRVLKPRGIFAAWGYTLPVISPEIDTIINYFHNNIVGEFWQPENRLVEGKYAGIPFPFKQIKTPVFNIQKEFTAEDMLGLFNSWSATQRFINKNGYNPVDKIASELQSLWGSGRRTLTWEIFVKAATKE